MDEVLQQIVEILTENGITGHVFVDEYVFQPGHEADMMQRACEMISQSDFVIAEVTHKAIGIGVEVGYAIGVGKPVIYIRHVDAEHSTTVAGISTRQLVYAAPQELAQSLPPVIEDLRLT